MMYKTRSKLSSKPKVGKYNNIKTNGYDSKKEYSRALELKQNEKDGYISGLTEQVKFILIPKQDGERQCTYIADFVYLDKNGKLTVEDVKSTKKLLTPEYIIKRKLMLYIHGIKIKETY